MRFRQYMNESSVISKAVDKIKKLPFKKVKKLLQSSWDKFYKTISKHPELEDKIIKLLNRKTNIKVKSLKSLDKMKLQESNELNEDWKHFWEWFGDQGWGALSIFPTLSIWFEIDNFLNVYDFADVDFRRIGIYALLWVAMITGKQISMWRKWKKDNPDEWEQEGKPGPFTMK